MKKQRFLFTLLMAIVMMAFSPQTLWAQEEGDPGNEECSHDWMSNNDAQEPTCDTSGQYESYTCNICGATVGGEPIPALGGHLFVLESDNNGNHYSKCSRCEQEKDHERCSFVNGVCTKCGYSCYHNWDDSHCTLCNKVCNNHSYDSYGSCTICGATCEIVSVTIGEKTVRYESFSAALTAALNADAATITLLQNFTINASITISQGNVTLDLNGHTISTIKPDALKLSGGSLTIMDGTGGNTGMIQTTIGRAVYATGGTITIHGGTFKTGSGPALEVDNSSVNVSIDGGQFVGNQAIILKGKSALAFGYSYYISGTETELPDVTYGPVMTVSSGPAPDVTVKLGTVMGTLTIGGETTNFYHFNTAFSEALDVESATIKMMKDVDLLNGQAPYSLNMDRGNLTLDLNGHVIYKSKGGNVLNLSGGSLTIMDGTGGNTGMIQTTGGNAISATGGTITIHGGKFKTESGPALQVDNSSVNVSIDGGQFVGSQAISLGGKSALAFGYSYYISGTDTELPDVTSGSVMTVSSGPAKDITVKPATVKGTLTIGGVTTNYYQFNTAFGKALDAASATITMMKDVELLNGSSTYSLNMDRGNLTLDLNGHTINQPRGGNVLNLSGGELTITDSSAGKTGKMQTVYGSALYVTGGTITIHDGTFSGADGPALYISQDATAFIDGGIFISSKGSAPAIENHSGRSILANGYALYNADDVELQETVNGSIWDGNSTAKYIIVKAIPVASVTTSSGTVEYTDLVEAKDAASNAGEPATITLLHDAKTDVNSTVTFYSGNVTLDLNGYTITSEYSSVIYVAGGSLTITDSSAGKTGKMVNADTAIYAYGGTINIQGGTFTSNNHTALYCISSEFSREPLAVSIEGGRFITKNENMSAIYSEVGSLLAPGYGFYDTDNDARLTNFVNKELMDENGNPAKDVTVKALSIDALDLADATPYDGKNAGCKVTDFTYTRNFGGTNWTTWYAPFDLELTDEICQKLAFSRINNVHQYDDDDNGVPDRTVIESFRQKAGVTLRANYPYLVKALNDADRNIELRLSNVTLAPAAENSIDCQSVDYIYTFTGTYAGMGDSGLNSDSPYSLNDTYWDNNWYHFRSLEPQRHYMVIEPTNGGQTPRNIKVRLNVAGEEDATGIVTLYSDKDRMQDEVDVYDLMGRKLNSNSTQRGLRIQNGKVILNK